MNSENGEIMIYMQRFTASVIALLNTMKKGVEKIDTLSDNDQKLKDRLFHAIDKFSHGLKNQTDEFDYSKFIKKVYYCLRDDNTLKMVREKDPKLFSMRDANNRIITIIPGVDIRFAMKYLNEDELKEFWPNFYLFISSTFRMIQLINSDKLQNNEVITETIEYMNKEIALTGVIFDKQIFNPFIGVQDENGEKLTVEQMFNTTGIKPVDISNVGSMESMLNMMGVENLISTENLKKQLDGLGEEHVTEATTKIVEMLGAQNNDDVKEVCGTLIKDIVENLKTNGIENIGSTLMNVANMTKGKLDINKMKKTAMSMQYFMNNSTEKMKEMRDTDGNPIGENLMNTLSSYMNLMNQQKQ